MQRAQELFVRLGRRNQIDWMSEEDALEDVRNPTGAKSLAGGVRRRPDGKFEVGSSSGGGKYEVEMDLVNLGPRPTRSMVVGCTCMDHIKRGPVCKHAGAVLLTLVGAKEVEEDNRGRSAASVSGPPAGDAVPKQALPSMPPPASLALTDKPRTVEEKMSAGKLHMLKAKAEMLRQKLLEQGSKAKSQQTSHLSWSTVTKATRCLNLRF